MRNHLCFKLLALFTAVTFTTAACTGERAGEPRPTPLPDGSAAIRIDGPLGLSEAIGPWDRLVGPLLASFDAPFMVDGMLGGDPAELSSAAEVSLTDVQGRAIVLRRDGGVLRSAAPRIEIAIDVAAAELQLRGDAGDFTVALAGAPSPEEAATALGVFALAYASGRPIASVGALAEQGIIGIILLIAGVVLTIYAIYHNYATRAECEADIARAANEEAASTALCMMDSMATDTIWVCWRAYCDCGFWCSTGFTDVEQRIVYANGATEAECEANLNNSSPDAPLAEGFRNWTRADAEAVEGELAVRCAVALDVPPP